MSFFREVSKYFKFNNDEITNKTRHLWRNTEPPDDLVLDPSLSITNRIKTSRYEIWNFLPLCLIEQFRKVANLYFLILIIFMLCMGRNSPISPLTTIIPLILVFTVSFVKQGYEDYNRHKSDNMVNRKLINVLDGSQFVQKPSESLKVGDIVFVENDEEFPCDIVLLSSSNSLGTCYITTVNFDGETNLKLRQCVPQTAHLSYNHEFENLACVIEYDLPTHEIYKFCAKFTLVVDQEHIEISISHENFLMRGALLKNTDFVVGIAVYIGKETKLALNQQKKRKKFSIVDKKLNKFFILMIIILAVSSTLLTLMHYFSSNTDKFWYINKKDGPRTAINYIIDIASFVNLLNHVIPISLSVTIEIHKFWNSFFIDWDLDMYDMETEESAKSNSSDTIEELGQIEYIFTDKTGTLTKNQMSFQQCVINDRVYVKKGNFIECSELYDSKNMDCETLGFWIFVAICHSSEALIKSEQSGDDNLMYKYLSPSPDEVALLEAAASLGIVFKAKELSVLMIEINSVLRKFTILHTLEFDSNRKKMSVVYQDEHHDYYMVCKGADSHVIPVCVDSPYRTEISKQVNIFSVNGYRTLVYAYKKLTPKEFEGLSKILHEAKVTVTNRENALEAAYNEVESGLTIVGATAVDDQLQDGVIETVKDLRAAGIKVWVLTGDKEETAISISYKCGHLHPTMRILYLCERMHNLSSIICEYIDGILKSPHDEFALILDGASLKNLLKDERAGLASLLQHCRSVLCCRMSPLQKSKIVNFVRKTIVPPPVTLAIGDGANDCSMIQEAHVGVGIIGREGRQAAYCSDYSFLHFRFLKKLLLFHGYNAYNRIAYTILYFFYKNLIFVLTMFLFVWYTNFSPAPLFSGAEITMYNTLVTSLPVLIYGIFEQIHKKRVLMTQPGIYRSISRNAVLSWWMMIFWLLNAIWQGTVIFYWGLLVYNQGMINIPDHYFTYTLFGTYIYSYIVICVTFQIQLLTKFWTLHTIVSTFGACLYYVMCEAFISLLYTFGSSHPVFASQFSSYYVFFNMLAYPHFWCGLFIVIPIAFFPYFTVTFVQQNSWFK